MCPRSSHNRETQHKTKDIPNHGKWRKIWGNKSKSNTYLVFQKKSVEIASESNYFEQTDTVLNKRIMLIVTNNMLPDFIYRMTEARQNMNPREWVSLGEGNLRNGCDQDS